MDSGLQREKNNNRTGFVVDEGVELLEDFLLQFDIFEDALLNVNGVFQSFLEGSRTLD